MSFIDCKLDDCRKRLKDLEIAYQADQTHFRLPSMIDYVKEAQPIYREVGDER